MRIYNRLLKAIRKYCKQVTNDTAAIGQFRVTLAAQKKEPHENAAPQIVETIYF